jgi:hypothetical protein
MSEVVKVSTARTSSGAAASSATTTSQSSTPAYEAAAEAKFLRLVHDGSCQIFSTVLGPEANDAHRTHLHLDLQQRKTSVCE